MASAADARIAYHVPAPGPATSYTVVRDRVVVSFTSSTTQWRTFLIGPHTNTAVGPNSGPLVAIYGLGANVPGTVETQVPSPLLNGYASDTINAMLHAVTAEIVCTSSTTVANGLVYIGAIRGRPRRATYPTWDDLGSALVSRSDLRSRTAVQLAMQPAAFTTYPLDATEWAMIHPWATANPTTGNNVAMDTLAPIVCVVPPSAAATSFNLTIYTEWRVIFNNDNLLASTQVYHKPSTNDFWSGVGSTLHNVGGSLEQLAATAGAVGGAFSSVLGGANSLAGAMGIRNMLNGKAAAAMAFM